MQKLLQEYFQSLNKTHDLEFELKQKFKERVEKLNKAYADIERKIEKKYDWFNTIYTCKIPYFKVDDFEFDQCFNDCVMIRVEWTDNTAETFSWLIDVPYKEEDDEKFVKNFEREMNANYIKLKGEKLAKEREENMEEFERLKEKLGK